MKKKFAVVCMTAMMAMNLCACGTKESATTTETTTVETTTEAATEAASIEDASLEDASTEDATTSDDSISADRGTVDENNVYTNESMGLSFTIDEGCTIYTDEQITQMLGIGQDIMEDDGAFTAEQFEAAMNGTFYDVWFAYPDGISNIYAAYEDLSAKGMSSMDEATYASIVKQQFEAVTSVTYTFDDDTVENYGGADFTCINAHTDQGIDQKLLLKKRNNYMICITISSNAGDTEIADNFLSTLNYTE